MAIIGTRRELGVAEGIHRAWILLWAGTGLLVFAAIQVLVGHAISKGEIPSRKKDPFGFWFAIGLWGALGVVFLSFSAVKFAQG